MKHILFRSSLLALLMLLAGTVSGQRSLTAFPLIKGDTNYIAFYSTAGQSPNSKFEFAADLQGNTIADFDPTEYNFVPGTSSGYSVDGYYMAGSQIFAIPVCWQDSSLNMFILANSLANDFFILYYAGVDGQPVTVANPEVLQLGFCGSGGGGIARISANNGLTVQGDTLVQLGGTLIKNTNIALESYVFSIAGPSSNPLFSIGGDEINLQEGSISGGFTSIQIGNDPSGYLLRNYPPGFTDYYEFGMNTFSNRSTWHYFDDGIGRTSLIDLGPDFLTLRSPNTTILGITTSPSIITLGQIIQNDYGAGLLNDMAIGSTGDTKMTLGFKDTTAAAVSLVGLTANDRVKKVDIDSLGDTYTLQRVTDNGNSTNNNVVITGNLSVGSFSSTAALTVTSNSYNFLDFRRNSPNSLSIFRIYSEGDFQNTALDVQGRKFLNYRRSAQNLTLNMNGFSGVIQDNDGSGPTQSAIGDRFIIYHPTQGNITFWHDNGTGVAESAFTRIKSTPKVGTLGREGVLEFQTHQGNAIVGESGLTTALTLDEDQNGTFAQNLTVNGSIYQPTSTEDNTLIDVWVKNIDGEYRTRDISTFVSISGPVSPFDPLTVDRTDNTFTIQSNTYGSSHTGTTDASGFINLPNRASTTGVFVTCTPVGATPFFITLDSQTTTDIRVQCFDTSGATLASTSVSIHYTIVKP